MIDDGQNQEGGIDLDKLIREKKEKQNKSVIDLDALIEEKKSKQSKPQKPVEVTGTEKKDGIDYDVISTPYGESKTAVVGTKEEKPKERKFQSVGFRATPKQIKLDAQVEKDYDTALKQSIDVLSEAKQWFPLVEIQPERTPNKIFGIDPLNINKPESPNEVEEPKDFSKSGDPYSSVDRNEKIAEIQDRLQYHVSALDLSQRKALLDEAESSNINEEMKAGIRRVIDPTNTPYVSKDALKYATAFPESAQDDIVGSALEGTRQYMRRGLTATPITLPYELLTKGNIDRVIDDLKNSYFDTDVQHPGYREMVRRRLGYEQDLSGYFFQGLPSAFGMLMEVGITKKFAFGSEPINMQNSARLGSMLSRGIQNVLQGSVEHGIPFSLSQTMLGGQTSIEEQTHNYAMGMAFHYGNAAFNNIYNRALGEYFVNHYGVAPRVANAFLKTMGGAAVGSGIATSMSGDPSWDGFWREAPLMTMFSIFSHGGKFGARGYARDLAEMAVDKKWVKRETAESIELLALRVSGDKELIANTWKPAMEEFKRIAKEGKIDEVAKVKLNPDDPDYVKPIIEAMDKEFLENEKKEEQKKNEKKSKAKKEETQEEKDKKASEEHQKKVTEEQKTADLAHRKSIEKKFRDLWKKQSGATDEQVDAILKILEARANNWAAEEKGRDPNSFYNRYFGTGTGNFRKGTVVQYQKADGSSELMVDRSDITDLFYSKLSKNLEKIKSANQSATAWLKQIGSGDEAVFTGLVDFLKSKKPDERVTKEEVLGFLDKNQIKIYETWLDNSPIIPANESGERVGSPYYEEHTARRRTSDSDKGGFEHKLYKEILIQVTDKYNTDGRTGFVSQHYGSDANKGPIIAHLRRTIMIDEKGNRHYIIDEMQSDYSDAAKKGGIIDKKYSNEISNEYNEYSRLKNFVLDSLFKIGQKEKEEYKKKSKDGLAWDNYERGYDEGISKSRSLLSDFMSELSSVKDELLLSERRKSGNEKDRDNLNYDDWTSFVNKYDARYLNGIDWDYLESITPGIFEAAHEMMYRSKNLLKLAESFGVRKSELGRMIQRNAVPEAPYISKTTDWTKLALKIALRDAVENKANTFSWVTGDEQLRKWGTQSFDWTKDDTQSHEGAVKFTLNLNNHLTRDEVLDSERPYSDYNRKIDQAVVSTFNDVLNLIDKIDPNFGYNNYEVAKSLWKKMNESLSGEGEGEYMPRKSGMDAYYGNGIDNFGTIGNVLKSMFPGIEIKSRNSLDVGLSNLKGKEQKLAERFEERDVEDYFKDGPLEPLEFKESWKSKISSIDMVEGIKEFVTQPMAKFQVNEKGEPVAALETLKNGRMILHAMKGSNVSSGIHELWHSFEPDLTPTEKAIADNFGGSEKMARAFERYLRDGIAPSETLKAVFVKFKNWLTEIYKSLKGSPIEKKITPEVKAIFDRMLEDKLPNQNLNNEGGEGMRERGFVKNVMDSRVTPEEFKNDIEASRIDRYYEQLKNKDIKEAAKDLIKRDITEAERIVNESEIPSGAQMALVTELLKHYYENKHYDKAIEMLDKVAVRQTNAGQFIQAASMYSAINPVTFVKKVNDVVKRVNGEGLTKEQRTELYNGFLKVVSIPEGEVRDMEMLSLLNVAAKMAPLTRGEKFNAFRYQNMLSSPLVHMRNIHSNTFNAVVLEPTNLLVKAGITKVNDMLKRENIPAERTEFMDMPRYVGNVFRSLPNAGLKFMEAVRTGNLNPKFMDLKGADTELLEMARQKNMPWRYTITQRLLEGEDAFFREILSSGELMRLRKNGVPEMEAIKLADQFANRYLYRENIGGDQRAQFGAIQAIDEVGKGLDKFRNAWGGALSWYIPFLRTPLNITKMMVSYSPLGFAMDALPIEQRGIGKPRMFRKDTHYTSNQISEALIGSIVMGIGGLAAANGNVEFAPPLDEEEKKRFFDSGRRPYSIRIGNRWVPFQYFGPLGLALAIPAAIKAVYQDRKTSLTDSEAMLIGRVIMNTGNFIMVNSPFSGILNLERTLSSEFNFDKQLGNMATQVIPGSGMLRYVNYFMDPIYRKSKTGWDSFNQSLPGMSQDIEPILGLDGQPVERKKGFMFWDDVGDLPLMRPWDIGVDKYESAQTLQQLRDLNQQKEVIRQGGNENDLNSINKDIRLDKTGSRKTKKRIQK